ncbi:MAG TPA: DinB family protein [Thermoanaerobaculia bacterium]|nr:DinB family protein [Thermoanaerobaculia bacterium]
MNQTARPPVGRPRPDEYAADYEDYVSLVPEDDVLAVLQGQLAEWDEVLAAIPEERGGFRYAPGKWTLKQLVGHMIDLERVYAYRALRFARNDATDLAGYDQDAYVEQDDLAGATLRDLADELRHTRLSTLLMLRRLEPAAWLRRGTADGKPFTVRALAYSLAGHPRHHFRVILERYLPGV